jgi:hypothetical protein
MTAQVGTQVFAFYLIDEGLEMTFDLLPSGPPAFN